MPDEPHQVAGGDAVKRHCFRRTDGSRIEDEQDSSHCVKEPYIQQCGQSCRQKAYEEAYRKHAYENSFDKSLKKDSGGNGKGSRQAVDYGISGEKEREYSNGVAKAAKRLSEDIFALCRRPGHDQIFYTCLTVNRESV